MSQPYIVGKRYMVDAVRVVHFNGFSGWVAILGPWHEDREIIKFDEPHYHVDWRFATHRMFTIAGSGILKTGEQSPVQGRVVMACYLADDAGPSRVRLLCRRELPKYPLVISRRAWLRDLEAAFAGRKLCGSVCPHRGLDLSTIPAVNRVVTCPGHGLSWNKKSGELVPSETLLEKKRE